MSLKYKPCCSQQGDQEFNFNHMVLSSSLRLASVERRRGQKACWNPGTGPPEGPTRVRAHRSHKRCACSLVPEHQSWDMQWYISFSLCPLWNYSFSSKLHILFPPAPTLPCTNLGATTPIYTVLQPRVATCQSELHLSLEGWIKRRGKEESRRTSALIKNVWGGKEGGGRGGERWR